MPNLEQDEQFFIALIRNTMPEQPTLIDIGFNCGDFSREFLRRYPTAQVFGFEPIPDLYERALWQLMSSHENIQLFNYGFSDRDTGRVPFYYVQGQHSGMSGLHYRKGTYENFEVKEIQVYLHKMDSVIDELPQADYMKIDTEGHELYVLQGAREYLKEKPPAYIQFEYGGCCKDNGTKGKDVVALLESCGYTVRNKNYSLITSENFVENYEYQNFLAIRG